MRRAGFVLIGGKSNRMGRDKALLNVGDTTLAGLAARKVAAAAGAMALIGDPVRYRHLGLPLYPDLSRDCGPMGGLEAALRSGLGDWNLVLACDLPLVTAGLLRRLLEVAVTADPARGCVVPVTPEGTRQPLCAVYHASCLPVVESALAGKRLAMWRLLRELNTIAMLEPEASQFTNANTPEEWAALKGQIEVPAV